MKPAVALFAALLLQAAPAPESGAPFDGGGFVISTLIPGNRTATTDPERAFQSETGPKLWLEIPAGLNRELYVGGFAWIKGVLKNGTLRVSEAIGFPVESLQRVSSTARTADCDVTADGVGGSCNHMPPRAPGACKPSFWGGLRIRNNGTAPVKVEVQRIFYSENKNLLGSATDKIAVKISKEGALFPLPCDVEPGKNQQIAFLYPIPTDEPHGRCNLSVTVILSVGGKRLIVRCLGEFSIFH